MDLDALIDRAYWHRWPRDSMAERLCLFLDWVRDGGAWIRDERGQVRPMVLNRVQKRQWLSMMGQAAEGKPIRQRWGKARRGGSSTFVRALHAFLCWHWPNQQAYCIAHRDETVDALQRMSARFARKMGATAPGDLLARIHRYPNGSFDRYATSGGQAVGAGDTLSLLHWSERAKWGDKKADTTRDTAIAAEWADVIIDESTFQGRDQFWSDYCSSVKGEDGYAALFIAWFEDERCTVGDQESFKLDADEKALIRVAADQGVELSFGQLAWRRLKIAQYGASVFAQEYPSTPEEAVAAGKGLILPFARSWVVDDLPFEYLSVPWSLRVGGIDFGYNDPCVIWSGVYWDQRLYLVQFWRGVGTLANDQVQGLMRGHTYYCDPANLSDRKELQRVASAAGLHVRLLPAPRKRHPGEDYEKSELHRLIDMGSQERLFVLRECSDQLLAECDDLEWNEQTGRPKMKRSELCGHYDSVMSLKYCVAGVLVSGDSRVPQADRVYQPTRRQSFARW